MLESGEGVARNVSAHGIYFDTYVACEPGASIKFTVRFPDFPSGPIAVDCFARVVRVEARGNRSGVAAAIREFEFYRVSQKH
jgi:hypothetical protein